MDNFELIFAAAGLGLTLANIIISRAVAIGAFKAQYKQLIVDVEKLKKDFEQIMNDRMDMLNTVRSYLFSASGDNIGRTIYMPRVDCKEETEECRNRMCKEFKRMEVKMDEMDRKRSEAKKEQNEKLDNIQNLLTTHMIKA